jgi:hypothetical protein
LKLNYINTHTVKKKILKIKREKEKKEKTHLGHPQNTGVVGSRDTSAAVINR